MRLLNLRWSWIPFFLFAVTVPIEPAWSHDPGPPGFPCSEGPFGVPGLTDPPSQIGQWGPVASWPEQGTHLALLHTGKVLWWRGIAVPTPTYLWDPITETLQQDDLDADMFCAGFSMLADGRVISFGGDPNGNYDTSIFNPASETWSRTTAMANSRYYPTSTTLPDGRVIAMGGGADHQEIFDPATNTWTELQGGLFDGGFYPRMFVTTTGLLLKAGQTVFTSTFNLGTELWSNIAVANFSLEGGTAMYRPDKILKVGGNNYPELESVSGVEVLDMGDASPTWRLVQSTAWPRRRPTIVMLPDGTALAVGGSVHGDNSPECAVHAAELWDPGTETWTTLASQAIPRVYHAAALLLPDGRVLSAGGEDAHTPGGGANYEIFSPPYLFNGARPVITSAPVSVDYNETFGVDTPDAASIASVVFIHPGAVTHNFDMNQRYVPLNFTVQAGHLDVTAPVDANLAPPGQYMLFMVNNSGVPSVAEFVGMAAEPATADPGSTAIPALSIWGLLALAAGLVSVAARSLVPRRG